MSNIIEITDFNASELDVYARISEIQLLNRAEPEKGIFIAESPKVIERALDSGCQPISFLVEHKHVEGEAKELIRRCEDIPVYTAEFDVLTQLTGFKLTRGMLCAMRRPALPDIVDVSAAALGMDAVLLTPGCSNPLYRRAIRVSMGTVFQIPWTFFDEKTEWKTEGIRSLKAMGFKTAAMALREDSFDIDDPHLMAEEKLAVILGTEGDGLASPMAHGVDSLNVAAASAVAFWQLGKR